MTFQARDIGKYFEEVGSCSAWWSYFEGRKRPAPIVGVRCDRMTRPLPGHRAGRTPRTALLPRSSTSLKREPGSSVICGVGEQPVVVCDPLKSADWARV